MLEAECQAAGVQVFLRSIVREVSRTTEFVVRTDAGEFHRAGARGCDRWTLDPEIGATAFGYDLARQFGLKIRQPRPALVPLVLEERDRNQYCDLTGVSTEVIVAADHQSFREKMLITHRGLSGPAILQISSYWREGKAIRIDLAPDCDVTAAIRESKGRNFGRGAFHISGILPKRFAARWLDTHAPCAWTNQALAQLERQVHEWVLELRARKATKKRRSQPAASIR